MGQGVFYKNCIASKLLSAEVIRITTLVQNYTKVFSLISADHTTAILHLQLLSA